MDPCRPCGESPSLPLSLCTHAAATVTTPPPPCSPCSNIRPSHPPSLFQASPELWTPVSLQPHNGTKQDLGGWGRITHRRLELPACLPAHSSLRLRGGWTTEQDVLTVKSRTTTGGGLLCCNCILLYLWFLDAEVVFWINATLTKHEMNLFCFLFIRSAYNNLIILINADILKE